MTDIAFPLSLQPPLTGGAFPEQREAREKINQWVRARRDAIDTVVGVLDNRIGSVTVEKLIEDVLASNSDLPESLVEDVIYEDLRGSVLGIQSDGLIVSLESLRRGA